jgi:hypothetical protein
LLTLPELFPVDSWTMISPSTWYDVFHSRPSYAYHLVASVEARRSALGLRHVDDVDGQPLDHPR